MPEIMFLSVTSEGTKRLDATRDRPTDEKTVAERKWQAGLKPAKPQKPCDVGLFSDDADQLDLVEMFQDPVED